MASRDTPIDVSRLINQHAISKLQYWIFAACFLVAVLDGFDSMAMGIGAPWIAAALKLDHRLLGPIFSASQAGFVIGAMLLGLIADRWGRKRTLVLSVAIFSVFSFVTASAGSFETLFAYRLLVGVGVGGAAPCFVGLACEYAPEKTRSNVIAWMWTGIPVGGIAGGLFAANVMPLTGWQSLFIVGGLVPGALAVLIALTVPESYTRLARTPHSTRADGKLRGIVERLAPGIALPIDARFVAALGAREKMPVSVLFSRGNGRRTAALWTACFFVWLTLTAMTAWSPSLLKMAGMTPAQTGVAMTMSMIGATLGTVFMGKLMQWLGAYAAIVGSLVVAALSSSAIGLVTGGYWLTMTFVLIFGLGIAAAVAGLVAIAAVTYPSELRSTSVGSAVGVGRIGSFIGPLLIGGAIAMQPSAWGSFVTMGLTSLIGAACVALLSAATRRGRSEPTAPADALPQ
ncbi:MAG: MFS transporter [Paraburkholderia sp.]|nr:MAG: MFS transporter [Paraburkholderia sp.]